MAATAKVPTLVALGDSITAGIGGKWNRGYPTHLQELLKTHFPNIKLTNWGIPGLTITRLTKSLQKGKHLHDTLADATCIVMTIGGNDVLKSMPKGVNEDTHAFTPEQRNQVAQNLDTCIRTLTSLTTSPIFIGDLYNPFPQSPLAENLIGLFNREIVYPLAERYETVHVVRISKVLLGEEHRSIQYYKSGTLKDLKRLWRHPIHPNDDGHAKLAQAFYQVITETPNRPSHLPLARQNKQQPKKQSKGQLKKQRRLRDANQLINKKTDRTKTTASVKSKQQTSTKTNKSLPPKTKQAPLFKPTKRRRNNT